MIILLLNKNRENANFIFEIHENLLNIAAQLKISILGFGVDRAISEFNV